ncbi:MAG: ribonuclease Z [archaeon]|nr:ribonuclease Z [archaeon]
MSFSVRFFGTSAASPSLKRAFACIGLVKKDSTSSEDITLMDCGDGSIRRILEARTSVLSISNILITHHHSDHLSGLVQLIETMSIEGRTRDLSVYGPLGLREYFYTVQKITNVASNRRFNLTIQELDQEEKVSLGEYKITPFSMQHTVPCLGYRVEHSDFRLAYTGDTEPCQSSIPLAKNVDLLIHEATYLNKDHEKARETKHSTPGEAAEIATKGGAQSLVLTHINDKHETEKEVLEEASQIHPKTKIAHDGFEVNL